MDRQPYFLKAGRDSLHYQSLSGARSKTVGNLSLNNFTFRIWSTYLWMCFSI